MSIKFQVLGKPGFDNAVIAWINSGNELTRVLLDCGENVIRKLKQGDVQEIGIILFSHLHIDHIAGFDYLFRRIFMNDDPIKVFGPEETSKIIHHRLNGFRWNLINDLNGKWEVYDIFEDQLHKSTFSPRESFKKKKAKLIEFNGTILQNENFKIETAVLNHKIPTIGYSIIENSSIKIDKEKLEQMNLPQGAWLENLKDENFDDEKINIENEIYDVKDLRKELLVEKPGEKITYLTDFIFDETSHERAVKLAQNSDVLICESQYAVEDSEFAQKNYHMVSVQTAQIAKDANVKKLILFHVSERYREKKTYFTILNEAREVFPETYFPEHWGEEKFI